MKTKSFPSLLVAAFGCAAFSSAGCAEKEATAAAAPPPAQAAPAASVTTPTPDSVTAVEPKWSDIKDDTFAMRDPFFAGLKLLEARVDGQIDQLTAKRATMKDTTGTREWDFAMKEMVNARSALKSMGEDLAKAGPETWDEQKDRVGVAWVRTQDAFGKVKASTTN